ncbi:DUF1028 domain-containing protein [Oscillatoria sp. CS-180]|uniref:DUF1028 domain-containing protein n=1 Tax=Oscillatoria sp. CS-180 TaxID=3021720 RepID=UPI00232A9707|nr:DUF1028 domain-containing protein [Oscillatoria sp. CS-180]MDB9528834.1 DUF1028 domain-containing protein [Oscillatoria sp. CS-180]
MTFSIVAWDAKTGMTGVAVATKHLAVGALVPHARAGVGAIATQAQTNPLLGIWGLRLLESRKMAQETLSRIPVGDVLDVLLQNDDERDQRQLHLVDHLGHTAAWTGKDCVDWAGHFTFNQFSVAGNMLVGEHVLQAMANTFRDTLALSFPERLLCALEAGEAVGGDKRGRQSAALYVVQNDFYPYLDLRVDNDADPIQALRTVFAEAHKDYYQSFRKAMPTHNQLSLKIEPIWLRKVV